MPLEIDECGECMMNTVNCIKDGRYQYEIAELVSNCYYELNGHGDDTY